MKIIFLVLVLVVYIIAAPVDQYLADDEDESKLLLKVILKKFVKDEKFKNPFAQAIIKSINLDCVIEKYKEYKMLNLLTIDGITESKAKGFDGHVVFINVASSCSNKLRPVLGFVFDSVFSLSDLIEAFRDDEPFKTYLDEDRCYNNYAVKHNYIKADTFEKFEDNLGELTEEVCDGKIKELRDILKAGLDKAYKKLETTDLDCYKTELNTLVETIFFKYLLLVPAKLTVEQASQLKENFTNDLVGIFDKFVVCSINSKPEGNGVEEGKVVTNEV